MTDPRSALKEELRKLSMSFGGSNSSTQQWVREGDRSHEKLQALDSLNLSYPDCMVDVQEAEASFTGNYNYNYNYNYNFCSSSFKSCFTKSASYFHTQTSTFTFLPLHFYTSSQKRNSL